jgi:hypothetical protein
MARSHSRLNPEALTFVPQPPGVMVAYPSHLNPEVPSFVPREPNFLNPNTGNIPSLTDVASEIRILIYEALFAGVKFEIRLHSYTRHCSASLGILSTCRLIHDEAVPYLSALATVWYKLCGVSDLVRSLDDLVPAKYLQNLKLVVFDFCGLGSVDWDYLKQLPALETLEIVTWSTFSLLLPGQAADSDVLPSDTEILGQLSRKRRNMDRNLGDLDSFLTKNGKMARSFRVILHMDGMNFQDPFGLRPTLPIKILV